MMTGCTAGLSHVIPTATILFGCGLFVITTAEASHITYEVNNIRYHIIHRHSSIRTSTSHDTAVLLLYTCTYFV